MYKETDLNYIRDIMYHIAGAYLCDRYIDENAISVWYEYLKFYDPDLIQEAVRKYVMGNDSRPSITDILHELRAISAEIITSPIEIKHIQKYENRAKVLISEAS